MFERIGVLLLIGTGTMISINPIVNIINQIFPNIWLQLTIGLLMIGIGFVLTKSYRLEK